MDCIFCDIAQGTARAKVVYEEDEFIVFENINPHAPVHLLVVPKRHIEKDEAIKSEDQGFWDRMMNVTYKTIQKFGLDKTGYRLVNNGAGYNMIKHEHIHILGGENWRPADKL